MKKTRKKSRVTSVYLQQIQGVKDVYFLVIPVDKKGRSIPSSVECAYNSAYYDESSAATMALAL